MDIIQQNYTGQETTPCWNILFWSFLSKTKRVWPFAGHIYGEFFLCALQLGLWNFEWTFDDDHDDSGGQKQRGC